MRLWRRLTRIAVGCIAVVASALLLDRRSPIERPPENVAAPPPIVASAPAGGLPPTQFPETIELRFEVAELAAPAASSADDDRERKGALPFGDAFDDPVRLEFVASEDGTGMLAGLLRAEETSLEIGPIGYEHDPQSVRVFALGLPMNPERTLELVGAVGTSALGYQYVFYDRKDGTWRSFHNWGVPTAADLDGDGDFEIMTQFEGKGLNFPEVQLLHWSAEGLQEARMNAPFYDLLRLDSARTRVLSEIVDPARPLLRIETAGDEPREALYRMESREGAIVLRLDAAESLEQ